MLRVFVLLLAVCGTLWGEHKDRRPSPPYITGDGFRAHCKFVLDKNSKKIDWSKVKKGDLIFVQTEYLPKFFRSYHRQIPKPYILVTHNSDLPIPGGFISYLGDPKLLAWYGQNIEGFAHPKLHPLPIGLENRYNSNGNPEVIKEASQKWKELEKTMLLYNNFSIGTSPTERSRVYNLFKNKPFCTTCARKPFDEYLKDLAEAKFVLCPRGNGLDCHRTWEALYMGAIPIVRSSALDSLYENLPVIIVSDWSEITPALLEKKYKEIRSKSYDLESLNLDFWLKMIQEKAEPKEEIGRASGRSTN
jgi:hypothetical protein